MNWEKVQKLVDEGFISCRKHPSQNFWIYNYTPKTQFEKNWCEETEVCRGLIVDENKNIIARPFRKFFNYEEIKDLKLPDGNFQISEKEDGCLLSSTPCNLWNGGTITIGEIVRKKLTPTLIGKDEKGNLIPVKVKDWFRNGRKDNWIEITIDCLPSFKAGCRTGNKLKITTNHKVAVNGGWNIAGNLKVGDKMIHCERDLDLLSLHVVRSGLLGDGSVSKTHESYCYSEGHCNKQKELTLYVRKWLGTAGRFRTNTISGYGSNINWVSTLTLKSLKKIRDEWYPHGKKIIPQNLSWIDDFAIAKWYMDDGSLSHHGKQKDRACFATNGFTFKDVSRIAKLLENRYGVNITVYDSKGWTIKINAGRSNEINNFWKAIAPHIIPSLLYKLPEEFRNRKYQERKSGSLIKVSTEVRILSIRKLPLTKEVFPFGRVGYDLKTETGNYFAKGVLVHNSLGLIYWINDVPYIATRGSFESEQAIKATGMLHKMKKDWGFLNKEWTYLVEIIYRENRIVVDYGDREDLILLAVINTKTGEEKDLDLMDTYPFSYIKKIRDVKDFAKLTSVPKDNAEGFVIRFANGLRLKMKFAEYVRLHKLITGVNERRIWDILRNNESLDELLDRVPDEFFSWVKETKEKLEKRFANLKDKAKTIKKEAEKLPTRKEQALYIFKQKDGKILSGVVFQMLDGMKNKWESCIWKLIKPRADKPFKMII